MQQNVKKAPWGSVANHPSAAPRKEDRWTGAKKGKSGTDHVFDLIRMNVRKRAIRFAELSKEVIDGHAPPRHGRFGLVVLSPAIDRRVF
jgi:hypothetical protein